MTSVSARAPSATTCGDGLSNTREFQLGTSPQLAASDGMPYAYELANQFDPRNAADADGRGLSNAAESRIGALV